MGIEIHIHSTRPLSVHETIRPPFAGLLRLAVVFCLLFLHSKKFEKSFFHFLLFFCWNGGVLMKEKFQEVSLVFIDCFRLGFCSPFGCCTYE